MICHAIICRVEWSIKDGHNVFIAHILSTDAAVAQANNAEIALSMTIDIQLEIGISLTCICKHSNCHMCKLISRTLWKVSFRDRHDLQDIYRRYVLLFLLTVVELIMTLPAETLNYYCLYPDKYILLTRYVHVVKLGLHSN